MIAALVVSTLVWMALEAAVSRREPHVRLPREVATGLALLVVHVSSIVEYVVRDLSTTPVFAAIGLALIACGIALRVSAIRTLGDDFVSTTSAPVHVIRRGPYRFMRHPSELGLFAAAVGAAVLLTSVVAVAIIAFVLAPLVVMRCAVEDRQWAR